MRLVPSMELPVTSLVLKSSGFQNPVYSPKTGEPDMPGMGVAFADEYAFVGCAVSGFAGMVVVVDMGTIEVVKVFDEVHPPGEDPAEVSFFINAVAEVAGFIVVVGDSTPPRGHQRPANHPADYTRVGVIDPGTSSSGAS